MVGLGLLPGDYESYAMGASTDGSVVVGASRFQDSFFFFQQPYRWTAETGMVGLGQLRDANWSSASGVSADGSVIVGNAAFFTYPQGGDIDWVEAFQWTEALGMLGLGFLPGDTYSAAYAVSADGSLVVGQSGSVAFIWDSVHGMRSLRDVLVNCSGLDLTGWTLSAASAISADGRSIVGWGIDPNGDTQAWLAALPPPTQCRTQCSDGLDNDNDGFVDFPADPGCQSANSSLENPECQDGINNDPRQDRSIDFDGGQSIHGICQRGVCPPGVSDPNGDGIANPDPQCVNTPWKNRELAACGLGAELVLVLPLLSLAASRRRCAN